MKQLARIAALLIAGAALAACSGMNQNVTPAAGPGAMAPAVTHAGSPAKWEIKGDIREIAAHINPGHPHFFVPRFRNKNVFANTAPVGYPFDMTCQKPSSKGACTVMNGATAYNIYVSADGKKCKTESCWGNPEEFLKALTGSPLAGIAKQYTGAGADKFKFGGSTSVTEAPAFNYPWLTYYNADLFTILLQGVQQLKVIPTGNTEFHIFLPPGADTCFDQTGSCYSPDNLSSFAFCAYHNSIMYQGVPIIYSVEPYQNAQITYQGKKLYGCQDANVPAGTNRLDSGTASTLLHESQESWSDPAPGTGWVNDYSGGEEVGDVCAYVFMDQFKLGSETYFMQQIYSNHAHGCASTAKQ
ncbi:MAG: hypothetical protein JO199_12995 [Candidatus Eremiobacteraeota bacterium]|nr:hypothetical protein [Candidatus Eremiobacteraeota bacterium]